MKTPQLLDTIAILKPISIDRLSLMEAEYEFNSALPVGLVGTIQLPQTRSPKSQHQTAIAPQLPQTRSPISHIKQRLDKTRATFGFLPKSPNLADHPVIC